jgi:hypothetical protein
MHNIQKSLTYINIHSRNFQIVAKMYIFRVSFVSIILVCLVYHINKYVIIFIFYLYIFYFHYDIYFIKIIKCKAKNTILLENPVKTKL